MAVPIVPLENFQDHLRRLDRAVVLFAADWCGYCRRFAPVFEEAALRSAGGRAPLVAADISDDEEDPRWEWYGIDVVPTVIYFEDGQPRTRIDGILGRGIPPTAFEAWLQSLPGDGTAPSGRPSLTKP